MFMSLFDFAFLRIVIWGWGSGVCLVFGGGVFIVLIKLGVL